MTADPRIIVERDGGDYVVRVEPDHNDGQFSTTYPSHKAASGYSRMLSKLRGWAIDDRTGEAAHG